MPADSPPPAVAAPARNRRSLQTRDALLSAAVKTMLREGATDVSARAICDEAGVSRGTLYRYFPSKDDLLNGVSLHLRDQTDQGLREAIAGRDQPADRLDAYLRFLNENVQIDQGARFLRAEPAFALGYFQRNFGHFIARSADALAPVFDAWDVALGAPVDRDAVAEVFVRYALSELLVPSGPRRRVFEVRLARMIALASGRPELESLLPALADRDANA